MPLGGGLGGDIGLRLGYTFAQSWVMLRSLGQKGFGVLSFVAMLNRNGISTVVGVRSWWIVNGTMP